MLQVKKLRKRFGGVVALGGVSIDFGDKGLMAIVGPNGSGKTTLLNVITAFLQPDCGTCSFESNILSSLPPYRIAQLGIARTFQELRIVRQISCLENLLLARRSGSERSIFRMLLPIDGVGSDARGKQQALTLLRSVRLQEKRDLIAGHLSYGEQKLLSILCVTISNPRVVLLDEPFSGLHPDMTTLVEDQLNKLASNGCLVAFIEHDIGVVRRLAKRVVVMNRGKILTDGDPTDTLGRSDVMESYLG